MPAPPRRANSRFIRAEVGEECPQAKRGLSGWFVDSLGEWRLDPPVARWTEGRSQRIVKADRAEFTQAWATAVADALDAESTPGAKPGEFVVHNHAVSSNAGAIIIARRLIPHGLSKLDLDFWREAFAEKTWLVQFSADMQKAIVYCPFVTPTDDAVRTILAAIENAVDLAEALLGVFETHPDAARTWQTWWCTSGQLILAEGGD